MTTLATPPGTGMSDRVKLRAFAAAQALWVFEERLVATDSRLLAVEKDRLSEATKQVHGCSGRVLGPTLAYTIERELELQERLRAHWRNELAQLDRNP